MNTEAGRSVSLTGVVFYILAGFGLLQTIAAITERLGAGRDVYLYAVAAAAVIGLLLIYLPLCVISLKMQNHVPKSCLPGRMEFKDWCFSLLLVVLLVILRVAGRPRTFEIAASPWFYRNLFCQMIAIFFFYQRFRRMGNRMMALGSSFAVLFLPSFINSVYAAEYQSLFLAALGILTVLFSLIPQKHIFVSILYALICVLCVWMQMHIGEHQLLHSMTMHEYAVVLLFYLFACIGCLAGIPDSKQVNLEFIIPFILLFLIYGYYELPIQEQGIFHVFLGASAGASIAHIFAVRRVEKDEERSRDMMMKENTKDIHSAVIPEVSDKKKPNPGEYLDNPLPVPKRHVKKEMGYAFEPEPEKLYFDISISDDDDFDLP